MPDGWLTTSSQSTHGERYAAAPWYQRTLLLADLTVGNDVAPYVTGYAAGTCVCVTAVLRKTITSDLTVRIKLAGATLGTFTVPHATAVNTVLTFTSFTASPPTVALDAVFTWDITASDGSTDVAGIATFTVKWK